MRRKPGRLLALEVQICRSLLAETAPDGWAHGYVISKRIRDATGARRLTSHGTLYKALGRLVDLGLLEATWEDPAEAAAENRPRRRYYRLSARGVEVARHAEEVVAELLPASHEAGS